MMENQGLLAPESYWTLHEDEKYEIINGCGPARATSLVPNTIMGINIKAACDIHDYTYAKPNTVKSREEADFLFSYNMRRLVDRKLEVGVFRSLAYLGVDLYLMAVRLFGGNYFEGERTN
ncbi:MAG: hypothetical protein ACK5Y2_01395 [Bdellovibrionales bacterium]